MSEEFSFVKCVQPELNTPGLKGIFCDVFPMCLKHVAVIVRKIFSVTSPAHLCLCAATSDVDSAMAFTKDIQEDCSKAVLCHSPLFNRKRNIMTLFKKGVGCLNCNSWTNIKMGVLMMYLQLLMGCRVISKQ